MGKRRKIKVDKRVRNLLIISLAIVVGLLSTYIAWSDHQLFKRKSLLLHLCYSDINSDDRVFGTFKPQLLDSVRCKPDETTTVQADGFIVKLPFEVEQEERQDGSNHIWIDSAMNGFVMYSLELQDLESEWQCMGIYSEPQLYLEASKVSPKDLWIATTSKQLEEKAMLYFLYPALQLSNADKYYYYTNKDQIHIISIKTHDDYIHYSIEANNVSDLPGYKTFIFINVYDPNYLLSEDELSYIVHHIEPAPRRAQDES